MPVIAVNEMRVDGNVPEMGVILNELHAQQLSSQRLAVVVTAQFFEGA